LFQVCRYICTKMQVKGCIIIIDTRSYNYDLLISKYFTCIAYLVLNVQKLLLFTSCIQYSPTYTSEVYIECVLRACFNNFYSFSQYWLSTNLNNFTISIKLNIPVHFELPVSLSSDRYICEITSVIFWVTASKDQLTTTFSLRVSVIP
jgi:hypothetical protein